MKRILLFERFINSKAYKATNAVNDTDDVKQEIYIHLMKVLPRYAELSEKEIKSVIFRTIDNKITDLVRKSRSKPDASVFHATEEYINFHQLMYTSHTINDGLYQLRSITDLNPEQMVMLIEFVKHIREFGESLENEKHQQFIRALISPPKWVEEKWEELRWTKGYQKTRYSDRIPTYTIGRLLGLRAATISKLLNKLTVYLNNLGYEVKRHNVTVAI